VTAWMRQGSYPHKLIPRIGLSIRQCGEVTVIDPPPRGELPPPAGHDMKLALGRGLLIVARIKRYDRQPVMERR
jgi:hypothetical protein